MNRKLNVALVVATIVLIAGCGEAKTAGVSANGSSGERHSARGGQVNARKGSTNTDKSASSSAQRKAQSPPGVQRHLTPAEIRSASEKIPLQRRYTFAKTAVLEILKSFGYPNASVLLLENGRLLLVTIPRDFACEADVSAVPKVTKALKKLVVFVRKVTIGVADNGGSLRGYVAKHCQPLEPPPPSDSSTPTAYSLAGTGYRGTPEFDIKSNRWTLSWENDGGALEIYVTQGNKLIDYVKTDKRGTGKKIVDGPGKFRITVAGSGNWEVRAYDGT
jgi:hypothetical protein